MGAVLPFPTRSVLPFRARLPVPVGKIANGLRRVAENFKGLHYDGEPSEPIATYIAAVKPMDARQCKEKTGIPLEFDLSGQHLALGLPHQPRQRVHILTLGNNRYQATLTDNVETEVYPYFKMTCERRVTLDGEGHRCRAEQTGLDDFFLKFTGTEVLLKALFEAMGVISEHTLAARAYVTAQFLMASYVASEATGVVLLADGKSDRKYSELNPELLQQRGLALKQIEQKLGPRADGFDLIFALNPQASSMARVMFTALKDYCDPELVIWLSEDSRLTAPALLREGLLKLYAKTEAFLLP